MSLDRSWWENIPFQSSQCHLVSEPMPNVCRMSVNPTNLILWWGTTCNLISHVCLFLITRPLGHHKISNSLQTRLWKDISHQTLWSQSYRKIKGFDCEFVSWQIDFQTNNILLSLINKTSSDKNYINTWHLELHFISKQKRTLQALTLQTCRFAPQTRWHCDLWKGICTYKV